MMIILMIMTCLQVMMGQKRVDCDDGATMLEVGDHCIYNIEQSGATHRLTGMGVLSTTPVTHQPTRYYRGSVITKT